MAPPEGLRLKRLRFRGQAGHYPGNLVLLGEERVETGQPGGKRQVQQLDAVQESNGTLLDNSLVLAVSEIQMPETHGQTNMPFILAGKAGGALETQRWLQVPSQPHNNLLVSILNVFGLPDTTFGHPDYCTGPLTGLV